MSTEDDLVLTRTRLQRANDIPATLREPAGPEDTPEKLEEERQAAQEYIDNGRTFLLSLRSWD